MDQATYRRLKRIYEPCLTPEELDAYINDFMGISLPWDTVDEKSNSSPLKCIWSIYYTLLTGEGALKHVLAVSRDSFKTFNSAIIQYFSMLHFRRDGNHIAAILSQSGAMIRYIDKFFNGIPELKGNVSSDNKREKRLINLPANDYTKRDNASLLVVTATAKGANSSRAHCFDGRTAVTALNLDKNIPCVKKISGLYKDFHKGKDNYVLSVNNKTGQLDYKKVINATRNINKNRVLIETETGKKITCTSDHKHAFSYNGEIQYKSTSEFKEGDDIFIRKRKTITLDKIKKITYFEETRERNKWVYDITVEDNHNFFANQVLTHNCMTFDEVDLTQSSILSEAAMIATQTLDGHKRPPIFVYLSSRKSNKGPIQELIDEANDPIQSKKNRTRLHMWSAVDIMERCPDETHKPELGSKTSYINTETLQTFWNEEDFIQKVPENQRVIYNKVISYKGCETCPAWVACQGRSVNQRGTSPVLKNKDTVGAVLSNAKTAPIIIAQQLNWKPETTGLVFKTFIRFKHHLSPVDFYEFVTFGKTFNPKNLNHLELLEVLSSGNDAEIQSLIPTKDDIYNAMIENDWIIGAGVDWGVVDDPAVCSINGYHKKSGRGCTLHVENAKGFANHLWAEYCVDNIFSRFPIEYVGPDTADPAAPSYFQKRQVNSLSKKPSRIDQGVSHINGLLWDVTRQMSSFAILDDCESDNLNIFAVDEFEAYSYSRDVAGNIKKNLFEDNYNHYLDSLRYFFAPHIKDLSISFKSNQENRDMTEAGLYSRILQGDNEAAEQLKNKQKFEAVFKQTLLNEGFGNVDLSDPRKIIDGSDKKKTNSSPIKFKF